MSRPKCLRCGASAEWIQGRVPDETETAAHSSAPAGSEASVRTLHLINAIRVWMNRAISHAENGNADKAESAIRSAREILATLEHLCLLTLRVSDSRSKNL